MNSRDAKKGSKTLITFSVPDDAAQRILEAFKKGEFAHFGVTNIDFMTPEDSQGQKQWTESTAGRRTKPNPDQSSDRTK